jgi:ribosomal protein S18 acetylase RimI-like enzyme
VLEFRKANSADITAIIQFQLAMAKETEGLVLDPQVCTDGVQAVFVDPERGMYYVCEINGSVAGSLLITYEWSDWRNGVVWWIQSVYVLPEFRKQGVYSGLYSHVQALGRSDQNVRAIRLYVDRRNKVAQKVYESLGMNGDHYQVFEWLKD